MNGKANVEDKGRRGVATITWPNNSHHVTIRAQLLTLVQRYFKVSLLRNLMFPDISVQTLQDIRTRVVAGK